MRVKWDQAFYYKCQLGPWQGVLKKGVQTRRVGKRALRVRTLLPPIMEVNGAL